MSSSAPFTGSALFLESVTQLNSSTIKLKFGQDPLVASSSGINDALNISNYTITGPVSVSILSITAVSGDPQSVAINLSNELLPGEYTITAANIQTAAAVPLTAPTYVIFTAEEVATQAPISGGALNDSAQDTIRNHLSGALKGIGWDALIAAIATGDTFIKTLAQTAFAQLFTSTASGKYLDRKASDSGFTRPAGVGVSDDIFRKLAIKIGAEKLTLQSFLQVLEIYYGPDAIRATIDSDLETFDIQTGDDLIIDIDGTIVTVVFTSNDFALIGGSLAIEVASAITRVFQRAKLQAYAAAVQDVTTGDNLVRIYSGALGLRGAIRVLGGKAQNVLNFATRLETTQAAGTTWDIDTPATLSGLRADRIRFTWTGVGTNPTLQLIRIDDIVNIYGTAFDSVNRGAYSIVDCTSTYFEVSNLTGTDQSAVAQLASDDIVFFRPTKQTINSKARYSMAAMGDPNQADVILAATTQAVARSVNTAAYLHNNDNISFRAKLECDSVDSDGTDLTIVTTTAHGFSVGDTYLLAPGQPDVWFEIPGGEYTVDIVTNSTTFKSSNVFVGAPASSATVTQYVYPSYRNAAGLVTVKTAAAHGLTSGQFVTVEGAKADVTVSLGAPYMTMVDEGLAGSGYLDFARVVKLNDGRVMVAGGFDGASKQDEVNIFDPETNLWAAAAPLYAGLSEHTLTTLANGRVLVTGDSANNCRIYDPDLDIWIVSQSMVRSRANHMAALLDNGKVLVWGGDSGATTAELYDPDTGVWTAAGSPAINRFSGMVVKLGNGCIFVCGGTNSVGTALSSAELYNPYNNTWMTLPAMSTARFKHQAVLISNIGTSGKVMVTGGTTNGTTSLNSVELYDIATNAWSAGTSFTQVRKAHTMSVLLNGNVVQFGGLNSAGSNIYTADMYDPLTGTWTNAIVNTLIEPGFNDSMVTLNNGKLLITPSINTNPMYFDPILDVGAAGGLNGLFEITVVSTTKFTYTTVTESQFTQNTGISASSTDSNGDAVTATATPVMAVEDTEHIGPYIYDPNEGVAITGISTTITQDIVGGQNYSTLTVTDASEFPDSGYLVFNFGYENETTPVPFIFNVSDNELLLDSAYTFPVDISTGSTINLLEQKGGWSPESPQEVGSFYVTDSISGRISASNTIDDISAAGIRIVKTVIYPSDRGLGNEGEPVSGQDKIADKVYVWGSEEDVTDGREE